MYPKFPMTPLRRWAVLGFALGLVVACAGGGTTYGVKVSGLADTHAPARRSYALRPAKSVSETDLQFREFSSYADRALRARGFVPSDQATAEVIVYLSYGVGDGKTRHYTRTGDGVVGGADYTEESDFYRWAVLEAIDALEFAKTQKVVQLWRTTMTSSGATSDLRAVFPALIAAGQPYFGADTGEQVFRDISADGPEVSAIRAK